MEWNGWQTQRLLDLFVSNLYAVLQKSGLTHRVTLDFVSENFAYGHFPADETDSKAY